ncbi:unnamed protein product, partial [Prorocentrum cordatum]
TCQHSVFDITEMEFYSSDGLLSAEVVGCSQETPLRAKSSSQTNIFDTGTSSDDCRSRICTNILDRGTSCGDAGNPSYQTGFQGAAMVTFAPGTWFLVRASGAVVLNQVKAYGNWGGRWPGDMSVELCTSASGSSCSAIASWNCGAPTSNAVPCDSGVFTYATTTTPASAGAGSGASAVGDPHLQNIYGQRFDLMKAGRHVLINIPRGEGSERALLRVQVDARRLGGRCADMYIQELNVTGSWAEVKRAGGYHYSVSQRVVESPEWVAFGKVDLKVVLGISDNGFRYLNVHVKHLGRAGFAVGGLLGEDDHSDVAIPPESCAKRLTLVDISEGARKASSAFSVAVATLA